MKKAIYSIAFVTMLSFASNAQDQNKAQDDKAPKETVNPDGTLKQDNKYGIEGKKADSKSESKKEEAPKRGGTRMAINEKGLPGNAKTAKKEEKPAATSGNK